MYLQSCEIKLEMAAILDAIFDFGNSSSGFNGTCVFQNLKIHILLSFLCFKTYI